MHYVRSRRCRWSQFRVRPAAKHSGWRYAYSAAREEKLDYVKSLLAHAKPGASVDQLLDLALDCLKDKLETQKFGKCEKPGKSRGSENPRYIPREVKREVWKRDGGQCTFVATDGTRCAAREPIEYDHVDAVGRGGRRHRGQRASVVPRAQPVCRRANVWRRLHEAASASRLASRRRGLRRKRRRKQRRQESRSSH